MSEHTDILVIGAGLTGLSAAYHAVRDGFKTIVLESQDHVGGLCSTKQIDGFRFDYSGHLLHFKDPYFKKLVRDLLGDNLLEIERKASIFSHGVFTPYPFQANLFGLPAAVVQDCLIAFARSYYTQKDLPTNEYPTFKEWIDAKLGEGIGRHFMYSYNEKLWTVPVEEMTCDWLNEYVPKPDIESVFQGALGPSNHKFGYNSTFTYPKTGGIQALADAMAARISDIRLADPVTGIDADQRRVRTASGKTYTYRRMISTLPLKQLPLLLESPWPDSLEKDRSQLRHNSILILNVGAKGICPTDQQWIYLPEKRYAAYRIGIYPNIAPSLAPAQTTSFYVEIAYRQEEMVNKEDLAKAALEQLVEMKLLESLNDVLVKDIRDVSCAYVIYDASRSSARKNIQDFFDQHGIATCGRYGNWEYSGMEEAMAQGKEAAINAYSDCR